MLSAASDWNLGSALESAMIISVIISNFHHLHVYFYIQKQQFLKEKYFYGVNIMENVKVSQTNKFLYMD